MVPAGLAVGLGRRGRRGQGIVSDHAARSSGSFRSPERRRWAWRRFVRGGARPAGMDRCFGVACARRPARVWSGRSARRGQHASAAVSSPASALAGSTTSRPAFESIRLDPRAMVYASDGSMMVHIDSIIASRPATIDVSERLEGRMLERVRPALRSRGPDRGCSVRSKMVSGP